MKNWDSFIERQVHTGLHNYIFGMIIFIVCSKGLRRDGFREFRFVLRTIKIGVHQYHFYVWKHNMLWPLCENNQLCYVFVSNNFIICVCASDFYLHKTFHIYLRFHHIHLGCFVIISPQFVVGSIKKATKNTSVSVLIYYFIDCSDKIQFIEIFQHSHHSNGMRLLLPSFSSAYSTSHKCTLYSMYSYTFCIGFLS